MNSFLTSVVLLIVVSVTVYSQEKPKLRFNENGRFKIVNFADLHFGEDPHTEDGPIQDVNSTRMMNNVLGYENPDFVVFTGDQITGDFMYPNASENIDLVLQAVLSNGHRWASTYGNHDLGPNVTREEILAAEQKYDDCYTLAGDPSLLGVTNYYLFVYPHESVEGNDIPALVLWFFDSRGGHNATHDIESTVDESVVDWFEQENSAIMETWGRLPALAFFHIPTLEYEPVQETIFDHPECTGLVDDIVVPQDRDTGFMRALIDSGTVKTAFVGHDHGNSWCCYYETLEICYNRHSGYGGYGTWDRGARVVEAVYDDPWGNYFNYIRLEDGSVLDHFPNPNSL